MFDPTIFDNLKVVLEGELYDREREGQILLKSRQDLLDLASFSRVFRMQFSIPQFTSCKIEIALASDLQDFAAELKKLHKIDMVPGCLLQVFYRWSDIDLNDSELQTIGNKLFEWWEQEVHVECVKQTMNSWNKDPIIKTTFVECSTPKNSIEFLVIFRKKINEQHIGDLPQLVGHLIHTSRQLPKFLKQN